MYSFIEYICYDFKDIDVKGTGPGLNHKKIGDFISGS